ncbi:hypothetical protein [Specibacter sp. RAF43]|uniref:hypothetical protein n=1 Tax=Specibacter sp. RAF43 TaxID=3233057 RepID=UPI003F97033A
MGMLSTWLRRFLCPPRVPEVPAVPAPPSLEPVFVRWFTGMAAVVSVTLWLAMAEVNRLVADAATATGRSASASSLQALDSRLGQENWKLWSTLSSGLRVQVANLLGVYTVLDLLFAVAYLSLLWRFFRPKALPQVLLAVIAAGELGEALLQLGAVAGLRAGAVPDILGPSLVATWAKWGGLGLLVVAVFGYGTFRDRLRRSLHRARRALFFQRVSVAVVVLISVLSLLPIPGVSDQMPDTERAWAPHGPASLHFWVTSAAVLVVGAGLFALGRRRSELAWDLFWPGPTTPKLRPNYLWWTYGPAVLLLGMLLVIVTGGLVNWPNDQFWYFLAVPLGLAGLSLAISVLLGRQLPAAAHPADPGRAVDIWRCGDVLSMVFVAAGGMALVRSFTAPVALELAARMAGRGVGRGAVDAGWSPFFLLAGFVIVVAAFPLGALIVRLSWDRLLMPPVRAGSATKRVSAATVAVFAVVLAGLTFVPTGFSNYLGVAGTAVLAVGSWAMVVGFLVVALQRQRPLPVFERLGLRATPVLTIIAVVLALGSVNGGDPRLHAVRQAADPGVGAAQPVTARETLQERFDAWLGTSIGCRQTIPGAAAPAGVRIRPMLLVAAEGGGIRAASWTAQAFDALASAGPCGSQAVLFSSGVSGGSLGLTLVHLYGGPRAVALMPDVADTRALAASVAGAAVGDMIGSGTGLMVPTTIDGARAWNDRAGLMESLWTQSAARLAEPFTAEVAGPAGALILNSTDALSGCRLLISQLDLPDPAAAVPAGTVHPSCVDSRSLPLSIDLYDQQRTCPLFLRWSTAALLSARFPIISPAGRVAAVTADAQGQPGCRTDGGYQAIDGGYSEGSGLGTVSDVWPALAEMIRNHNACAGAPGDAGCAGAPVTEATRDIIVPVFLYLQNSPGADIVPRAPKAAGELAIPLVGLNAKSLQSASSTWLQRLEGSADVCPLAQAESACQRAAAYVRTALNGHAAVVVAPSSVPALVPPLGWSLSPMSQAQLTAAMRTEAGTLAGPGAAPRFANLLAFLRRAG